jgi:hypothetical protein
MTYEEVFMDPANHSFEIHSDCSSYSAALVDRSRKADNAKQLVIYYSS